MLSTRDIRGFEEPLWFEDFDVIIGVDEVGRGALAGPLCACAVALKREVYNAWLVEGPVIRDSKKMSRIARARAYSWMADSPLLCANAWITPGEIDTKGITWANTEAMQRAVDACREQIEKRYKVKIISDNVKLFTQDDFESFPRAESRSFAVACASIWAKESRDTYMKNLEILYPGYGWESHVGYGTLKHRESLQKNGPTVEHRHSFISNYLD